MRQLPRLALWNTVASSKCLVSQAAVLRYKNPLCDHVEELEQRAYLSANTLMIALPPIAESGANGSDLGSDPSTDESSGQLDGSSDGSSDGGDASTDDSTDTTTDSSGGDSSGDWGTDNVSFSWDDSDSRVTNPDGSITFSDGSIAYPDGTFVDSFGDTFFPDGSAKYSDGSVLTADGTWINPDGSQITPDGTFINADGTVVSFDSSQTDTSTLSLTDSETSGGPIVYSFGPSSGVFDDTSLPPAPVPNIFFDLNPDVGDGEADPSNLKQVASGPNVFFDLNPGAAGDGTDSSSGDQVAAGPNVFFPLNSGSADASTPEPMASSGNAQLAGHADSDTIHTNSPSVSHSEVVSAPPAVSKPSSETAPQPQADPGADPVLTLVVASRSEQPSSGPAATAPSTAPQHAAAEVELHMAGEPAAADVDADGSEAIDEMFRTFDRWTRAAERGYIAQRG
jgi:hypothetical protein